MKMRSLVVTTSLGTVLVLAGMLATSKDSAADPPVNNSLPVARDTTRQYQQPASNRPKDAVTQAELQRRQFMQSKLTTANKIVKGLATEDFRLLRETAIEWIKIADSASWKVRRDPIFIQYSRNFQSQADRLRRAAERQSIEEATFAYVHATVTCTACHQHVRGVVQVAPAADAGTRRRF